MGDVIGEMLPSAVGIAVSPIPIVAIVLMLVTPRANVNGPAFVLGWVLGILIVGGAVLLLSSGAGAEDDGEPATWVGVLKVVLGVALLFLAAKQWRSRPVGDEVELPKWMASLDSFTPVKALGFAAVLSGLNPKNLLLVMAGAAAIAEAGLSTGEEAASLVIFAVIAAIGVMAPMVLYFVLGARSQPILDDLKDWLSHNNATIMTVLLLILGVKLIGDAISALA